MRVEPGDGCDAGGIVGRYEYIDAAEPATVGVLRMDRSHELGRVEARRGCGRVGKAGHRAIDEAEPLLARLFAERLQLGRAQRAGCVVINGQRVRRGGHERFDLLSRKSFWILLPSRMIFISVSGSSLSISSPHDDSDVISASVSSMRSRAPLSSLPKSGSLTQPSSIAIVGSNSRSLRSRTTFRNRSQTS